MNWKMFALVCTMAAAVALAANAQSVGFPIPNASGVPQKPAVIHLPPGVHRLEKPIVLKPENSGVTYVADGDVVISGARPVTDWRLEPDGTWSASVPWVKFGGARQERHSPGSYTIVKSIPTAPDGKAQGKGVERGVEWGDTSFDASIFATNPILFNR